jgi:hypothetical protein
VLPNRGHNKRARGKQPPQKKSPQEDKRMQTLTLGNNETLSTGVFPSESGWTALTLTQSKSFKTVKGAIAWLAKRGYNADGTKKA